MVKSSNDHPVGLYISKISKSANGKSANETPNGLAAWFLDSCNQRDDNNAINLSNNHTYTG